MIVVSFCKRLARKAFRLALTSIDMLKFNTIKKIQTRLWHRVFRHFVLYRMNIDLPQACSLQERIKYLENYDTPILARKNLNILLDLFKYSLEILEKPLVIQACPKKTYIIHLCVWGDDYSNKFLEFLAPSLLSPENIPIISNNYNILLYLHCDAATKNKLSSHAIMQELTQYCTPIYDLIPQKIFNTLKTANNYIPNKIISWISNIYPNWKYYLLGCLQNAMMIKAQQQKVLISFLMPDLLFSKDAFLKLFAIIDSKKAIAATAFRSLDYKVAKCISSYSSKKAICIPANDLANIAVRTIHPAAVHRIASNNNPRFQLTAQILFHYPQEIVIRSLHYHPLLVDFAKVNKSIAFDFSPIDSNFMNNIIDNNNDLADQIWVADNANQLCFIEISSAKIERIPIKNKSNIILEIQKQTRAAHWTSLNHFLVSKRCKYIYEGKSDFVISDLFDSAII